VRNVIVTGGSRGLGLEIACKLSCAGYRVIAVARKESRELAVAMQEAEVANPGSLHFVPFDLAAIEGIPELVKSLRKRFGAIYGLVNNAGISFDGTLALMPTSQIEQLVRVNTISPIVLSKYVVRSMMAAVYYACLNATGLGSNILSVPQLYGTTHSLFSHLLPSQGVSVRFAESDCAGPGKTD
jgi:3-oxoacyl-[acyl-carrier protein] reductase